VRSRDEARLNARVGPNAPTAVAWYKRALGAVELWNLGSVAGLEVAGAPFFVGQPEKNGWESPAKLGVTARELNVIRRLIGAHLTAIMDTLV
jgi:hypothetical protein